MKQIQLEASLRTALRKNAVGRLRREKKVPAVVYGQSQPTVSLEMNPKDVHAGLVNALIKLTISGDGETREETVMLKTLQRHPVTSRVEHADFIRIDMDRELETRIPVLVVGSAPGVKAGGILEQVHRELDIRCLPSMIPENVTLDVSGLEINDAITVADLPLQEGVEILVDKHEPVVHVVPPRVAEEEEAKPAEAVEATAETKEPEVIGEKEREERRAAKDKGKED